MKYIAYLITFFVMFTLFLFLLTGCSEDYRYYCQDINNWSHPQCGRPMCELDRTCPDLIFGKDLTDGITE